MVQRRQERDLRFFLPLVSDLTEPQARLVLVFQAVMLRHAAGAVPALLDQDVADAAEAVAATLETARKGVIYEHQAGIDPGAATERRAPGRARLARARALADRQGRARRRRSLFGGSSRPRGRPPLPWLATNLPSSSTSRGAWRRSRARATPGHGGATTGGGSSLIITG